jgi:hypothetical protein
MQHRWTERESALPPRQNLSPRIRTSHRHDITPNPYLKGGPCPGNYWQGHYIPVVRCFFEATTAAQRRSRSWMCATAQARRGFDAIISLSLGTPSLGQVKGKTVMKSISKSISKSMIAMLAASCVSGTAWAGEHVFAYSGQTVTLNGTVESDNSNNADPFTLQVFSAGNECLRIFVTQQGADLKSTLVSPSGRIWQDDDSGGSLRPLIKAITNSRGWYSLMISQFAGTAVHADFTVQIARLSSSDPACSPPTSVRVFAAEPVSKPQAASGPSTLPTGTGR